ncbi:alpha/beta fold hydrolase [Nocardia fluminea]|nr:alpha/beta fold hydrolase [Nocardia fluminea]
MSAATLSATPAAAAPGDFYTAPTELTGTSPGDILRTEPMSLTLSIPGTDSPLPARATRILYRSNDTHGRPVAVSGVYYEPTAPWTGPGARPLITYAVGTQGQGDACAPSKTAESLIGYTPPLGLAAGYETPLIELLAARGFAVVATDYHGLGTPEVHDWLNREAQAHAVLDAARAATRLPGTAITASPPIGIFGYSQGGAAAAAAAELHPRYAPELDVRGASVGAPPADLMRAMPILESSVAKGYLAWFLNGLSADYPQARPEIEAVLSPAGLTWLDDSLTQCIPENVARYSLVDSRTWTRSGQTVSAAIAENLVLRALLEQQRIGTTVPTVPVLMTSSTTDDIVDHHQVVQLAADWCGRGASVQLDRSALVPPILHGTSVIHVATYPVHLSRIVDWMTQRLAAIPAPSNCGS